MAEVIEPLKTLTIKQPPETLYYHLTLMCLIRATGILSSSCRSEAVSTVASKEWTNVMIYETLS